MTNKHKHFLSLLLILVISIITIFNCGKKERTPLGTDLINKRGSGSIPVIVSFTADSSDSYHPKYSGADSLYPNYLIVGRWKEFSAKTLLKFNLSDTLFDTTQIDSAKLYIFPNPNITTFTQNFNLIICKLKPNVFYNNIGRDTIKSEWNEWSNNGKYVESIISTIPVNPKDDTLIINLFDVFKKVVSSEDTLSLLLLSESANTDTSAMMGLISALIKVKIDTTEKNIVPMKFLPVFRLEKDINIPKDEILINSGYVYLGWIKFSLPDSFTNYLKNGNVTINQVRLILTIANENRYYTKMYLTGAIIKEGLMVYRLSQSWGDFKASSDRPKTSGYITAERTNNQFISTSNTQYVTDIRGWIIQLIEGKENYGFIIRPPIENYNLVGINLYSAYKDTIDFRPRLEITYTPPPKAWYEKQ